MDGAPRTPIRRLLVSSAVSAFGHLGAWLSEFAESTAFEQYYDVVAGAVYSPEIRVAAQQILGGTDPSLTLFGACMDDARRILGTAGITSRSVNWRGRPVPIDHDPVRPLVFEAATPLLLVSAVVVAADLAAGHHILGGATSWAVPLAAVALLVVGAAAARLARRVVGALAGPARERWATRVRQEAVLPYLREYLNRQAMSAGGTVLALRHVPGLGAADGAARVVDRRVIDATRELVNDLDTGAIAVAGPRGAGKTTLLRVLCAAEYASAGSPDLRVLVSAPVDYDARDFLLHVYLRLCETVLEQTGRRRRPPLVPALAVVTGTALVVWQVVWPAVTAPRPTVREGLVVAGVALVAAGLGYRRVVRRRADDRRRPLAERARLRREQLRYVRTYTVGHSAGASGVGLSWGRSTGRQLAEQPLTLPELVASYRDFVEAVTTWWRVRHPTGRLVVGIDEVDRIAEPARVERFVNDLKAMFGTRDCVYLVTVSDEALSSVEGRAPLVRTALDSTFEELVRVPPMDLPGAVDLLQRRVVGLPYPFLLLCHCLAGGLPRELIRAARKVIAARRETGRAELGAVARHVIVADARAAHLSVLGPLAALPGADLLLGLTDDPDAGPAEVLAGLATAAAGTPELRAAAARLSTGWRVAATLAAVFERRADEVVELFAAPPEAGPPADPWLAAFRAYQPGEGRIGFRYNGIRYEQDASGGFTGVAEDADPVPLPADPGRALLPAIDRLFAPLVAARDVAWRQPDHADAALDEFARRAGDGRLAAAVDLTPPGD